MKIQWNLVLLTTESQSYGYDTESQSYGYDVVYMSSQSMISHSLRHMWWPRWRHRSLHFWRAVTRLFHSFVQTELISMRVIFAWTLFLYNSQGSEKNYSHFRNTESLLRCSQYFNTFNKLLYAFSVLLLQQHSCRLRYSDFGDRVVWYAVINIFRATSYLHSSFISWRGRLAIIRCKIFCLPVCYPKL